MYIYMQINIWELIKPLNAGKFWQSKNMHADPGTKEEKNVSFAGKDIEEGKPAASKQSMEFCYSAISMSKGSLLVRSNTWHKEKNKNNETQKDRLALLTEGDFTPHHYTVQ